MAVTKNNGSKLKLIDLSTNDTVASGGGTDDVLLQPSSGYIYRVNNIYLLIPDPSGSTSGTHQVFVRTEGGETYFAKIKSATGGNVAINYLAFEGDIEERPTGATEQLAIIQNLIASNDFPLEFAYTNSTDANQTGNRQLNILVEEIPERA